MTETIKEIIERIRSGIKENGEFELQLIDQMALANGNTDIQKILISERWTWTSEDGAGSSIKISGAKS